MPGQGYHLGIMKLVADKTGRKVSSQLVTGTLIVDALNAPFGGRRRTHFAGGGACVLPTYTELRNYVPQSMDSGFKPSFLVDPITDMRAFEATSIHVNEGDYKDGIRIHLLTDRGYDQLVHNKLFDFKNQKDDIVVVRATNEQIDGKIFRQGLYASYPFLDNYVMHKAGITSEDVLETKEILAACLKDVDKEFISKYLNLSDSEIEWEKVKYFSKSIIDELIEKTCQNIINYLAEK